MKYSLDRFRNQASAGWFCRRRDILVGSQRPTMAGQFLMTLSFKLGKLVAVRRASSHCYYYTQYDALLLQWYVLKCNDWLRWNVSFIIRNIGFQRQATFILPASKSVSAFFFLWLLYSCRARLRSDGTNKYTFRGRNTLAYGYTHTAYDIEICVMAFASSLQHSEHLLVSFSSNSSGSKTIPMTREDSYLLFAVVMSRRFLS